MKSNKTVFSTRGKADASRMKSDGVNGTEMAFHATNFIFKNGMEKSTFKFSGSRGRRRHVHGLLTTTKDDLISHRRDSGAIDRTFGLEDLFACKRVGVKKPGRGVFRGRDEEGLVSGKLKIHNHIRMVLVTLQLMARLGIPQIQRAVFMARIDKLIVQTPGCSRYF